MPSPRLALLGDPALGDEADAGEEDLPLSAAPAAPAAPKLPFLLRQARMAGQMLQCFFVPLPATARDPKAILVIDPEAIFPIASATYSYRPQGGITSRQHLAEAYWWCPGGVLEVSSRLVGTIYTQTSLGFDGKPLFEKKADFS